MMITKTSSFKFCHAKGEGSTDLLHDTDKNHNIFRPKGNSEVCTEVPKERPPTSNGHGFFYKRRRLSRGGVAVLQEKETQDQSSDFVQGLNESTTSSTSLAKAVRKTNLPSKSSKNASVQKVSQGVLTHIECTKLCRSIINDAALEDRGHSTSSQTFNRDDIRIKASFQCKACENFEESSKMLICDCCEAAYHLSCCEIGRKILGEDEEWFDWYCQACSLSKATQSRWEGEISGDRRNILNNPIQAILVDKRSYRSAVRIGEQYQADVPDWVGPINKDSSDYFSKPIELDVIDDSTSELWCHRPRSKSCGNWFQCQEIINTSNSDELTICGKWRRVPLEVVQTDDWYCSYLLLHDPFHADCAVPQEAATEEVIKQLKVLEKARQLLENHKKIS